MRRHHTPAHRSTGSPRQVPVRWLAGAAVAALALGATSFTAAFAGAPTPPAAQPAAHVQAARASSELAAGMSTLSAQITTPGTAVAMDPVSNQVIVTYDQTVTGAKLQSVRSAVTAMGAMARMQPVNGVMSLKLSGGDAIYGQGVRCSLGFSVQIGGTPGFLTAGHCGNVVKSWFADAANTQPLGTTTTSTFPGNDFALVQVTSATAGLQPAVGDQVITTAGTAQVGEAVTRRGSTTGVHTGTVTALDATVNYAEGRVTGLIQTTVCAEPGDSGGPLFDGQTALGITSGGSGNCTVGGITFFQPVTTALQATGATLLPSGAAAPPAATVA